MPGFVPPASEVIKRRNGTWSEFPKPVPSRCASRALEVVLSASILVELRRCLDYPKLRKFIRITDEEIDRWILALELIADMVRPSREVQAIPDDPDDDHLLATALEGRAAFLVTGDRHVFALGKRQTSKLVAKAIGLQEAGLVPWPLTLTHRLLL